MCDYTNKLEDYVEEVTDYITNNIVSDGESVDDMYVRKIIEEGIQNKKFINECFGLNLDNKFTRSFECTDIFLLEKLEKLENVLKNMLCIKFSVNVDAFKFDWENNKCLVAKNNYKISKLLNTASVLENSDFYETLKASMRIIYRYIGIETDKDTSTEELFSNKFLARIFEYIRNIKSQYYITTAFNEFISASHNSSFTSCYRPGGEYCSSTISFARDPYTFMVYATSKKDPNYKIGRCWWHISQDNNLIIRSKIYGCLSQEIENEIIKMLSPYIKWTKVEREQTGYLFNTSLRSQYIYIDSNYLNIYHSKNKLEYIFYILEPQAPICLSCGEEIDQEKSYNCSNCNEISATCCCCGERVSFDDVREYCGEYYCDCCFSETFTYCERCGDYYPSDECYDVTDRHGYGSYWCSDCRESDAIQCVECNGFFSGGYYELEGSSGEYVCEYCLEHSNIYITCDCCDEIYRDSAITAVRDKIICDDCLDHVTIECEICRERVLNEDLHKVREFDTNEIICICEDCVLDGDKVIYCEHCGETTTICEESKEHRKITGDNICYECLKEGVGQAECSHCGCTIHITEEIQTYYEDNSLYLCDDCRYDNEVEKIIEEHFCDCGGNCQKGGGCQCSHNRCV